MAASAQVIQFPGAPLGAPDADDGPALPLSKLKKAYKNAIGAKVDENAESAEAERYFHGVQWTTGELKTLKERGQPPIVYNRIKRKINTITGIIEKLRQDPKAFPRNPQRQAEDGAEIATKTLLYALGWDWQDTSTTVARRTAVRGLAGVEMVLVKGDQGDPEIDWDIVDQRDFFYDPRSVNLDFSDARYMGTSRMIDLDEALEAWPEFEEELTDYVENGAVASVERGDERKDINWLSRDEKRVRIVDHWFMKGSKWFWAIYCGDYVLEHGQTYIRDHKGMDVHKFEMMSFEVDQDGDRYGAFRDLKSAQDEINHRRSKALHSLNNRKVIADEGAVDDVEAARREYSRADGWVVKNVGKEITPDDPAAQAVVQGNLELLQEAKAEIETYGPNPGLIGTDIPADSGRAIQLLQAAGIAELGSYMLAYKHWKVRVYRKTWCACQQLWQAERWIRVTDDENLAQFIQVNGWQKDEMGNVQVLNQLSALDVDIILDEGTDQINAMADTFETLVQLGKGGAQIPPEMYIELSPLASSTKQRIMQQIQAAQQPKPMDQQAMMLQMELLKAQIMQLQSQAQLNTAKGMQAQADAGKATIDGQVAMQDSLKPEEGQQIDTAADMAKARLDQAKANEIEHKIAVGAHLPEQAKPPPPVEPGLFEVNQAKAREHHAKAGQAEAQTQVGWSQLDTQRADQLVKLATADKLAAETETIHQAPPGMLSKPPPRPASVPSAGKKR